MERVCAPDGLKGEHVHENKALHRIEPIAHEDFVSVDDARARLLPLLRPLPTARMVQPSPSPPDSIYLRSRRSIRSAGEACR
jgi:hypothetical protein